MKLVKAIGQEVIDRAEDLVGDTEGVTDFDIWLRFPPDSLPTIEVQRSLVSKECFDVFAETE